MSACSEDKPNDPTTRKVEVVAGMGHGQFFNSKTRSVDVDMEVALATQRSLIEKWSARLGRDTETHPRDLKKNYETLDALLLLAEDQKEPGVALDKMISRGVFLDAAETPVSESHRISRQALSTNLTGEDYIQECIANGVPVPNRVLSDEWTNHGVIQNEFLSQSLSAELWSWEDSDPDGICVALPRWDNNDEAQLFGVICLGRQTSKVCYFDNPTIHPGYSPWTPPRSLTGYSIENFIGGADLELNPSGGMCTDCHAGANPFVVHPQEPAFVDLKANSQSLFPNSWPEPIVHPNWVQNPGPLASFPPATSGGSCESCHGAAGGRFPLLSTDLPGYCSVVLGGAIQNTMPPAGDPSIYTTHIAFLEQLCVNPPTSGNVVQDPPSNLQFLSPPIVIAPLYECAETVGVRGARLNSSVNVFVDGVPVASGVIRDPDSQDFVVPPLQSGQVVWATQTFGGVTSLNSNVVEVRHYLDDYPNGLPAPTIEPQKTHECAYQIAVKHVPGANLMVVTNSGTPRFNGGRSGGYTVALGDGPFSIGDQIEVYQEMCQDESNLSAPIFALAAPSPLRAVAVDPADVYETQELFQFSSVVEGATVHIDETSVGAIDQIFSWPTHTTHRWDFVTAFGRPFLPGDELAVTQELCVFSPTTQAIVTKSCEELNTLEVATLIAGQDYVIVSNAVPGASIRVYDSNGDEIGDGGESMILLSRQLEEGETITLVQELGVECVSDEGIEYIVNPGSAEPINQ